MGRDRDGLKQNGKIKYKKGMDLSTTARDCSRIAY
jgi:hypothetical protein